MPGRGTEAMSSLVTLVGSGSGISLSSVLMASGVSSDPRGSGRDKIETGYCISASE